ncbi:putative phage tail protein [Bradyrhizobium sp. cir1]|uniref:tail assembly protein n=1 Tax=Bradyrhizobium sp. cir1 TaxID=1445730 RepID=UPI0016056064|nr:tail assembly protein [Bradyrhizobium sp. cir1]MBB4373304.1 putative phage tail protein [Bradyrhizobium sp. cir1]
MLRTVHLHGKLGKDFGKSHRFDVATAAEAMRALNCAFPGRFVKAIKQGYYKIVRGDKRNGMQLDLDLVNQLKLGTADLHIIPVAKGAASNTAKGTTKLVLGAALVGGAIFLSGGMLATPISALSGVPLLGGTTYGSVAAIGLGLALSGASTLLTKPAGQQTQASNGLSINGGNIGNSGKQGDAIPLIYGECLVGSTPISVWSDIEDISVYADSTGSIETAFDEVG